MKSLKRLKRYAAVLLGASALLTACGGGSEQIETFAPKRIIVFGDEVSLVQSDGRKYTVNAVDSTTNAVTCSSNPVWTQSLASYYGMVFPQCNPDNVSAPAGKMYAAADAKVAEVVKQVDAQFSLDGFNSKDLVTVLAGGNDVLELYKQYPALGEETLKATAQARGEALAAQVNRIANAGGKVIVSTVLDMGLTPYAIKEKASHADINRAALLTELSRLFNVGLRLKIINDGRMIGLVLADEMLQSVALYPAYYGYANVADAACLSTALPPTCTTATLVTGADASTWMWAGDTVLAPGPQSRLASLAQSRATNNPF